MVSRSNSEEIENIRKDLEIYNQTMEISKNSTIRRGILMFIRYGKIKLAEFSKTLGRAKSTIIHHLKKFEKTKVIEKENRESHNRLGTNYYEYKVDFEKIMNMTLADLGELSKEEEEEIIPEFIKKDYETFRMFNKLLYYSMKMYTHLNTMREIGTDTTIGDPVDVYKQRPVDYHAFYLTQEEKAEYTEMMREFTKKILAKRHTERHDEETYDHLVFNANFSLEHLIQFDPDQMKFIEEQDE